MRCRKAPRCRFPNDPTNGGRVLLLLQDKGVLKLKQGVGFKPTVADIIDNPKKFKIVEVDAAQTARTLGRRRCRRRSTPIMPRRRDSIRSRMRSCAKIPRDLTSNIIVVRTADKDKPWVKLLVQSYQTPEVRDFVLTKFKGAVLPAW